MAEQLSITNEYCKSYLPEGALGRSSGNKLNLQSRKAFEEAASRGVILESTCLMCDCTTMQLSVDLPDGIRGIISKDEACFVPNGTSSGGEIKDIAIITRVGKPVQFKVTNISENQRGETVATLSRRAAQVECYRKYLSTLTPGDIIPARITHLEPFGAFCDIGCGIISLLTVDKVSVSRISHPADRFKPGEFIYAVVSSVEDGRIYLSHRELLGTWEENAAAFAPGQTVTGIIRSVEDYGVFVELSPNLAGLAELYDGATPGQCCSVYIKSIIPERMKIKLVLIDTCGEAEAAPCRYYVDTDKVRHIDRWLYSPVGCKKTVETVFCDGVASVAGMM
ncbi:MAG: S1 RNA-binding domain-containing protein [Ruminococcaceae bacterium]|nr:S1 RNA-binding domain-containing protein [Oscillospiraceae bacterium]